ncbi:hypothetical protein K378_02735 [Streptomyces sp. Amel2xB2]|nr:hypothetical protein K378_02735 [Streptomyces sp. Amel2xB2]
MRTLPGAAPRAVATLGTGTAAQSVPPVTFPNSPSVHPTRHVTRLPVRGDAQ